MSYYDHHRFPDTHAHALTHKQRESIEDAFWSLKRACEQEECYCLDDHCTDEEPLCTGRALKITLRKLDEALDPDFSATLHPQRLVNPSERIFLETWLKENKREAWVNGDWRAAEFILGFTDENGRIRPRRISQAEATILATFIQWLGTSCGYGFIHAAERAVREEQSARAEFSAETRKIKWKEPGNPWHDIPSAIARQFATERTVIANLAGQIRRAMEWARKHDVNGVVELMESVDAE